MVVICEKCGKKYRVDPIKIKGQAASFNCHVCSHVIMVFKTQVTLPQPDSKIKATSADTMAEQKPADGADIKDRAPSIDETKAELRQRPKAEGLGLRAKMILLFFFIPSIVMAGAILFYLGYFETISSLFGQKNAEIVNQRIEAGIADESSAIAMMPRSKTLTDKERPIVLVIFGAALLLMGIIVLVYANRLTEKIESLTDVADRISAGELEMEIELKSKDEIGELARAIARLRDDIRLYRDRV